MPETKPKPWVNENTNYQILLVSPGKKDANETAIKSPYIATKILVRTKGEFDYDEYPLYDKRDCHQKNVGSNLPSSGVRLKKEFEDDIIFSSSEPISTINNFYDNSRSLLQIRKISQLIAKTWHNFLEAKKTQTGGITNWDCFVNGEWDKIDSKIVDGLIAREIFFVDQSSYPSSLDPEKLDVYYPLYGLSKDDNEITRFLILPNSLAWRRITLSLLIAGQAYREISVDGKKYYHQICEPILSTGEIVNSFALDVDWSAYTGKFKEVQLSPVRFSTSYQVSIPYPPIPSEINLSSEEINKWAEAPDEGGDFPFYGTGDEYTDIKYASPPYPYLPLSTT